MSGGAIPLRIYSLLTLVGFKHPEMIQKVLITTTSTFLVWTYDIQTKQAYSAASADVLRFVGSVPYFV